MSIDITLIIVACIAIAGVVFFFPKIPPLAQLIVAIVGIIACILVLLKISGVVAF